MASKASATESPWVSAGPEPNSFIQTDSSM